MRVIKVRHKHNSELTMSFPIPENATKSEKMAVIERALTAIADGTSTEVSLHFVEPVVAENKPIKIVRNEKGQVRIPWNATADEARTIMIIAEAEAMDALES
jgi:hypothetical protein